MDFTVTIPDWVFTALSIYFFVGIVLYVPTIVWMNKFISPRPKSVRENFKWMKWHQFITRPLVVGFVWPILIWDCVRNELKYGVGRRLRNKYHLDPCCSSCKGTGISGDPTANGLCWDCRSTGHPHELSWWNRRA